MTGPCNAMLTLYMAFNTCPCICYFHVIYTTKPCLASTAHHTYPAAGDAFAKLGDLTKHLQGSQQNTGVMLPCEEEVEMLHNAVRTSSEDLSIISETIEQRTKNDLFVIKNCRCYDHNKMSNFLKKSYHFHDRRYWYAP